MANTDNSFYIDRAGLALLLDSKNVSELYMLNVFGEKIVIDDDTACKTLFDMVSEHIITVDGEEFALCEDVDYLVNIVVGAKWILTVYSNQQDLSNLAIYIDDENACMLSACNNRPNYLKLQHIPVGELYDYVLDYFSIEPPVEPMDYASDVYLESLQLLSINDDFEHVISSSRTQLFVSFDEIAHRIPIKRAAVIQCIEGMAFAKWSKDGVDLLPYTNDELSAVFSDM